MGDELFGYSSNQNGEMAIQEAAASGLKSMDDLIRAVSKQTDCREITDSAVSTFRTVISTFNRTGHARFRRAPVKPELAQPPSPPQTLELFYGSLEPAAALGVLGKESDEVMDKEWFSLSTSGNSSSSTLLSSITGEGSFSNRKGGGPAGSLLDSSVLSVFVGEPPPGPSKRCREHKLHNHNHSSMTSGLSLCHCKKKKSRVKKTIRVPAISSKIADIPADEYSWRKYGQKPIKNSPYPRGYYKCSTVRGCPAKKHVERANDDPALLIVTYSGEHLHAPNTAPSQHQLTVVESATRDGEVL